MLALTTLGSEAEAALTSHLSSFPNTSLKHSSLVLPKKHGLLPLVSSTITTRWLRIFDILFSGSRKRNISRGLPLGDMLTPNLYQAKGSDMGHYDISFTGKACESNFEATELLPCWRVGTLTPNAQAVRPVMTHLQLSQRYTSSPLPGTIAANSLKAWAWPG